VHIQTIAVFNRMNDMFFLFV